MDCTPPTGGEVLPPLSNAPAGMELDVQPAPSQPPFGSPTEWAAPSSRVPRRLSCRWVADTAVASDTATIQPSLEAAQPSSVAAPPGEDTGQPQLSRMISSLLPLELSGVPSMRIVECLAWQAGHTHFDPAQTLLAIRPAAPYAAVRRHVRGLRGVARLTLRDPPQNTRCRQPATGQLWATTHSH